MMFILRNYSPYRRFHFINNPYEIHFFTNEQYARF